MRQSLLSFVGRLLPMSSDTSVQLVPNCSIQCSVCCQLAFGLNYGVPSCNACKMFFRRMNIIKPSYTCLADGSCYTNFGFTHGRPKCRSCRFRKCLDVGMKYRSTEEEDEMMLIMLKSSTAQLQPDIFVTVADELYGSINSLRQLDARRAMNLETMRSDEDPTIEDLIKKSIRGFTTIQNPGSSQLVHQADQVLSQWTFFGIWTSVEFLNSLDFMSLLGIEDKLIVLKSFALSSYLLSSAFHSCSRCCDRLVNPDGTELYSSRIREMSEFSKDYADRIQEMLVTKICGLCLTPEEYILTQIILFCTPRLTGLSQFAQEIIGEQQKKYCNSLLEYCKLTRNTRGPARFQEIISIGSVLAQCFEDVQHLSTVLKLFYPDSYNNKKLFADILHK
ncbi:Nuclear Hormone Receptor family [Caenorhabditis elegans]|uniref:Nuclear Hormone Receptor family n=1 Tax=Caenorhabditis elegans TaxID=6239 RepID=O01559_CAEEL|nr:Nuclear Hormone Receptor family [Caenorhabditis elegans]CCD64883.2 Nuclear Hormone Receptor family [Caenorhabditis elegans]|eukprot:NP_504061.2 Nuclear Hormone Receptor family [Caenorhabditis elegans]